jgi:hypothetical protein
VPRPAKAPPEPDEAADVQRLRDRICEKNGIVLQAFDKAELNRGKTPDFKLMKDGQLVGYCEIKSLFDPGVMEDPPEGEMAVRKNLPYYRKLGQNVRAAAQQLDAVNGQREKPNVVVFVSHSRDIERKDLIATIAGLPVPGGPPLFMLGRKMQGQVCNAARKVDLFLWIDAETGECKHLTAADAKHRAEALELFGLQE